MIERTDEMDQMFEAREALRTWRYKCGVMTLEKKYQLVVQVHSKRIEIMLNK